MAAISREHGLGRRVKNFSIPPVVGVERVYLMTTNGADYRQLGFKDADADGAAP